MKRRTRPEVVLLGSAALLACSACAPTLAPLDSHENGAPAATSQAPANPSGPIPPLGTPITVGEFPITGLPAAKRGDIDRPAVAVVVSGSDNVEPIGLQAADTVVEEVVEPGQRRLLAVFQSKDAPVVGPVGEARPVDSVLLPGWRAMYAYEGGRARFVDQAREAGAVDVGSAAAPDAYTSPARAGGTFVSTAMVRRAPQVSAARAAWTLMSIVDAAAAPATTDVRPAGRLVVTPPGHGPQTWSWDAHTRRYQNRELGVAVANLVIRTVQYKTLQLGGGASEPSARVLGSGALRVASQNRIARGTWIQQHPDAQVRMFTANDGLIGLAPGPTWVLLAPAGTKVRVVAPGA